MPALSAPVWVAAGAGACFCAAGVLAAAGATDGTGGPPCPFRTLTGWPCPLCGATRATVAAVSGEWGWMMQLNFFWPLVLVLAFVTALSVILGAAPLPDRIRAWMGRHHLFVILALLAVGWGVALVNRAAILA